MRAVLFAASGWTVACGGAAPRAPVTVAADLVPYVNELVARASERRLHERVTWHRLLHYRPRAFGGVESEADGDGFFMAADGSTSPEAELAATLRGFFASDWKDERLQHPFCRFPARLAWLNGELGFASRLPKRACPKFDEFVELLEPSSATLVFSSYYLNNPASSFGHTFLRINKANEPGTGKREELLDYGIDYSASVDTNNAIAYAFKGLTGLFRGDWRKLPYYYKVREYNDYESRDIWEYDLALSKAELELIVAHLWEIGSTYFAYYYLDENCSYHVLAVIEAASPRLTLLDHLRWPVLPIDTVKALYENPGLVRDVHFRPSNRRVFRERLAKLAPHEQDLVAELASDARALFPKALPRSSRVRVLDAAIDHADMRFAQELVEERDTPGVQHKQTLLERRAEILVPSEPIVVEPAPGERPHVGHDAQRLALGPGYQTGVGFYHHADLRLALHSLSDPATGYPDALQILFLPTRLRYYVEENEPWLEEIYLVEIVSLTPQDRYDRTISWKVKAGTTTIRDEGCSGTQCLAGVAELGGGGAFGLFNDGWITFFTVDTQIMALGPIDGGIVDLPIRAGVGPAGGFRIRFADEVVLLARGQWLGLPFQDPWFTWSADQTLTIAYARDFAIAIQGQQQPDAASAQVSSAIYF